jgi:hypothetical protein
MTSKWAIYRWSDELVVIANNCAAQFCYYPAPRSYELNRDDPIDPALGPPGSELINWRYSVKPIIVIKSDN